MFAPLSDDQLLAHIAALEAKLKQARSERNRRARARRKTKELDRIEALEQQGRSAIRPGFFDQKASDYLNSDAVPSTGSTIYRGAKA